MSSARSGSTSSPPTRTIWRVKRPICSWRATARCWSSSERWVTLRYSARCSRCVSRISRRSFWVSSSFIEGSVPRRRGLEGARRLGVDPVEVLDVLPDLRVAQALVRHGNVVELFQHRLGIDVALEHLFRRLEPARQPGVGAPLGYADHVRSELLAFAHRV